MIYKSLPLILIVSISMYPVAMASETPFYLQDKSPLPFRNPAQENSSYQPGKVPYADWLIRRTAKVSKQLADCYSDLEELKAKNDQKNANWTLVKIQKKEDYLKFLSEKFEKLTGTTIAQSGYEMTPVPNKVVETENKNEDAAKTPVAKNEIIDKAADDSLSIDGAKTEDSTSSKKDAAPPTAPIPTMTGKEFVENKTTSLDNSTETQPASNKLDNILQQEVPIASVSEENENESSIEEGTPPKDLVQVAGELTVIDIKEEADDQDEEESKNKNKTIPIPDKNVKLSNTTTTMDQSPVGKVDGASISLDQPKVADSSTVKIEGASISMEPPKASDSSIGKIEGASISMSPSGESKNQKSTGDLQIQNASIDVAPVTQTGQSADSKKSPLQIENASISLQQGTDEESKDLKTTTVKAENDTQVAKKSAFVGPMPVPSPIDTLAIKPSPSPAVSVALDASVIPTAPMEAVPTPMPSQKDTRSLVEEEKAKLELLLQMKEKLANLKAQSDRLKKTVVVDPAPTTATKKMKTDASPATHKGDSVVKDAEDDNILETNGPVF
jgi:hypothetical protein